MSAEVDASTHADHAHVDGKCTSWVDEALDAAGPEYADAPRPELRSALRDASRCEGSGSGRYSKPRPRRRGVMRRNALSLEA